MAHWKRVIFSEELLFSLFPTTGRVYVWRELKEAFHLDCLQPTVKHVGGSVMIWGAISLKSAGPMIFLHRRINIRDFLKILSDQVHPIAQVLFPEGSIFFKDNNDPIHTARTVKEWQEEHCNEVEHLV